MSQSRKKIKVLVTGEITPQLRYIRNYTHGSFINIEYAEALRKFPKFFVLTLAQALKMMPDVLIAYPSYPFGMATILVAKIVRRPFVSFVYGNDLYRKSGIGRVCVNLVIRHSDGTISDCKCAADEVVARGGRNAIVLPMGIDLNGYPNETALRKEDTVASVINFGLAYWKGVDLLIMAIASLDDAKLVLVGDGDQRKMMEDYARRIGAEKKVIFTGKLPRKDLWTQLQMATIYALATRRTFHEGSNRSVLEAMYAGLPVIVTRVGGLPEIVEDKVNGAVIEPEDADALRDAIRRLLIDKKARTIMSKINHEKAKDYLTSDISRSIVRYLEKICGIERANQTPEGEFTKKHRTGVEEDRA